jgi:hypothetical protein
MVVALLLQKGASSKSTTQIAVDVMTHKELQVFTVCLPKSLIFYLLRHKYKIKIKTTALTMATITFFIGLGLLIEVEFV